MVSAICRLTVSKQMELDLVIMVRPALNMGSMKRSFLHRYEEKTRILTKTNTLSIIESHKIWRITL